MAAELIGELLLIAISSTLIRLAYPATWLRAGGPREDGTRVGVGGGGLRLEAAHCSRYGWHRVGHKFVMDWKMVWEEILIGFTVAGFVAVFVPAGFWAAIFLTGEAAAPKDRHGFAEGLRLHGRPSPQQGRPGRSSARAAVACIEPSNTS